MKTNKLPIKVRAGSLIDSISQKSKEIDRLTKRLLKVQNECKHISESNTLSAKRITAFDCSECYCRLYINTMKTYTLFLDFDGVLNNDRTTFLIKNYVDGNHIGFDRTNSNVLNNFLKYLCTEYVDLNPSDSNKNDLSSHSLSHNELKIVICSNWRNFYTLQEMKGLLKFYLEDQWIDLIVDTTEIGELLEREWSRAEQVKSYIDKHNVTDYIILDDECSYYEFPEMAASWIKTDDEEGLTEEDIIKWKEINQ